MIKVDNLVIEAENVFIEPRRRRHDDDHKHDRRVDPFFGRQRHDDDRVDPFFGRRHKDDDEVGGAEDRDHKRDDVRGEEDENERHHRKRGFWF
ncbi:hypothetical protein [Thalassobacillus pellis]|uniref:hypothetical protein n=1 Tax=Thalassobacillus pellis TaxID=748008 RepID=UPI0030843490|nr:transcription initiation factor TFIIIB Brf1 subunit/transcription initiation factor TFIIB [Thalassobacillus pellis]